jgi:hypothetical protein
VPVDVNVTFELLAGVDPTAIVTTHGDAVEIETVCGALDTPNVALSYTVKS